jgi:hypothetical protein
MKFLGYECLILKDCGLFELRKYQAPKSKSQINSNDPNSKFQTNDSSAFVPKAIIIGRACFARRYGPTALDVLVIGY